MALKDLSGTYVIDASHSELSFVTRHAMVTKVRGSFEEFAGAAELTDDPRLDLTIRGVTRTLTIPFEYQGEAKDPFGNERVGFEGAVDVLRPDFGLTWNAALATGGFLVSDKVRLEFEISAIKQA